MATWGGALAAARGNWDLSAKNADERRWQPTSRLTQKQTNTGGRQVLDKESAESLGDCPKEINKREQSDKCAQTESPRVQGSTYSTVLNCSMKRPSLFSLRGLGNDGSRL